MKKSKLKKLAIGKESIVALNTVFGGALPTTQQSTVVKVTKEGVLCKLKL
ncbi:hypothetical protein [uncultured Kordia sp.]|nr:hypothetical protein [uncultured Kordia sp.]